VITVDSVEVRAGDATLLAGASAQVDSGEVVAIVGPNGAGKSTLLSVMAGDLPPSAGSVRLGGEDLAGLSIEELSRRRAVLTQDLPSRIPFTIEELVALGRHPHRRDAANSDEVDRMTIERAIAAVELTGWERRTVATLSGGERLRAHLARVLAQETPVILLDEPTASLDVAHQEQVFSLAQSMAEEGRATAIVVHDLNAAARYADRILLLDSGHVRADGAPHDVLREELLSEVYRHPVRVIDHPYRDCPLVLVVDRRPSAD
jgi:iron complex transport system ATP-binding protein